jgi:hypothetical protein
MTVYEVRPRKDHRGVDVISDALPFGRLWYDDPNAISNAIGYARRRRSSIVKGELALEGKDEIRPVFERLQHVAAARCAVWSLASSSGVFV